MELESESIENIEGYEGFYKNSEANIFYSKPWIKVSENCENEALYIYKREEGEIKSFLGLSKDENTYYSLPFWDAEKVFIERDLNEFIQEFEELESDSIVLSNIYEEQAKRLEKYGFISYPVFAYPELEINSEEEFWESLDRNQRKNLKKAKKIAKEENLEIVDVSSENDLKDYYELEKELMERKGESSEPIEHWRDILNTIPKENLIFVLVKKEGKAIAGRISFVDKNKIFNLRLVSSKKYQKYRVNELLHLYVIEEAIKRGIKCINYGPSGMSNSGSYLFKKKFANKDRILWESVYPLNKQSRENYLRQKKENFEKMNLFLSGER